MCTLEEQIHGLLIKLVRNQLQTEGTMLPIQHYSIRYWNFVGAPQSDIQKGRYRSTYIAIDLLIKQAPLIEALCSPHSYVRDLRKYYESREES